MLYKTILKLHRGKSPKEKNRETDFIFCFSGLPGELQTLGDQYTKEEFKRHKNCSEQEAQVFISSWAEYAINLAQQLGLKGKPTGTIGEPLPETALDDFRDEQVAQLYELLKATKGLEEGEIGKKDGT